MEHEMMHNNADIEAFVKNTLQKNTEEIAKMIQVCEDNALINEQWFLDFMDILNSLSVKY